ncbi:MAG: FtsQ-type POTRA domain-containing protein [Acidobacteria bacterium]|nr:FtsQ-type POTRA domain-containing protein [Acidobacteriota bacterium]
MKPEPRLHDDLDAPESSPYLRRSKRVEVRRDAARWRRVLLLGGLILLLASGILGVTAYGVSTYLTTSPRFTLQDSLAIAGVEHVTREQVAEIFANDIGRSVFSIPLERRRAQLMVLPWVETAHVVRGWPSHLGILIRERRPVAFVRAPSGLSLIDREGVLLPILGGGKFPFPVLDGISQSQAVSERKKRVGVALAVLADLDRETPARSGEVSEIDLSDPNDAAITVSTSGTPALVHLGNAHFLERYKLFLENVEAWREQYGSVRSVDLRFEKQVIVRP